MSSSVQCEACGHVNATGANFCSECGHRLADAPAAERAQQLVEADTDMVEVLAKAIADPAPVLVVERGHRAGTTYLLEQDRVTIGRHPDSDIFLDDITVSRQHATVTRADDGWRVADVGSLNGTYLNRERVEDRPIRNGDHLQVGKFRLVFIEQDGVG